MHKEINIEAIRTDYRLATLHKEEVDADPIIQFRTWFEQAVRAKVIEVNAMTLATVDQEGRPTARIVLLKDIEDDGFVFYTNYQSNKGLHIAANPHVSLVFFWADLQRQVRIDGEAIKVREQISVDYFHSRPLGSQLGAWASPQSRVITDRSILNENLKVVTEQYKKKSIPKPPHWGGYMVEPYAIEFWQGRTNRLHDRILYRKEGNEWTINRLAP